MHLISANPKYVITKQSIPFFSTRKIDGSITLVYKNVQFESIVDASTTTRNILEVSPDGCLTTTSSTPMYSVEFDEKTAEQLEKYKSLHTKNPLTEEKVRDFLVSLNATNPEKINSIVEEVFSSKSTAISGLCIEKYAIVLIDKFNPNQLDVIATDSKKDALLPLASSMQLSASPNETYAIITVSFPTISVSFN